MQSNGYDKMLIVSGLSRSFGGVVAVDDVSFDVGAGEIVGLVGSNGAGKSTIVNLVVGALRRDRGTIMVAGTDVTEWTPVKRARWGVARTFQGVRIFYRMTVLENLLVASEACGRHEADERVEYWLTESGLSDVRHRVVSDVTFGQQKIVSLVAASIRKPHVLLVDEPLAGLDGEFVEATLTVLRKVKSEGCAVLFIDHNAEAVARLVDRVVFLNRGRVISVVTPGEMFSDSTLAELYFGIQPV